MNTNKKNCFIRSVYPTVFLTFTFFIFALFELYLTNKGYFFFSGDDLLSLSFLLFVSVTAMILFACFVLSLLSVRLLSYLIPGILALGLSLYIQGNFLFADYGVMDGTPVNWSEYRKEGVISVLVFVAVFLIVFILRVALKEDSFYSFSKAICLFIVSIQIVTLAVLFVTNGGLMRPDEYVSTTNDEFDLSTNENFIILMLDSFDSQAMGEILNDDCADEYTDALTDFTYYPDTLADYAYTDLAFPAVISGELYYNDETYGSYLNRAYGDSPLLNTLEEKDWYCGIYTTSLFADNESSLKIDNCKKIKRTVSSHKRLAYFMYKLVGFRYLIQPLKQYCWFYPDDMKADLVDTGISGVDTFNFNNFMFYDGIDELHTGMDKKSFHMYHIDGTHPPFDISPDFVDTLANNWEEDGIYDEARAMMKLVSKFLTKLKDIGVYDNSTIIIMADHGYLQLRQSPIFLVKGKADSHEFEIDDRQLAYTDLQSIFANILNGKTTADDIVDIPAGNRERIYKYYKWNVDLGYDSYARDLTEYRVYGNCWEPDNVVPTGNVYSHGIK